MWQRSDECPEENRLPGAVRPDHRNCAAGGDRKAEISQHLLVAEANRESLDLEHVGHAGSLSDRPPHFARRAGKGCLDKAAEANPVPTALPR